MWDLIVSVPDHCLSFYFCGWCGVGTMEVVACTDLLYVTVKETTL